MGLPRWTEKQLLEEVVHVRDLLTEANGKIFELRKESNKLKKENQQLRAWKEEWEEVGEEVHRLFAEMGCMEVNGDELGRTDMPALSER
jgi:uncharacterized coiled-coil DUF342 family protein